MKRRGLSLPVAASAVALALVLSGCSAVQKGADILAGRGKISEQDRAAIVRTSQALRSTFADITEEEEYYIGRAVAAQILSRYKPYENADFTSYLNTMGMALAYGSDRPETYGGYHFLMLDSDEVNAMAAPGGFIFVTRGLVKRCRDEETLAAVLAHEIGHVAGRHGLQSIQKSRLLDAFKVIGSETAKKLNSEELTKLTGLFEGVLGDIVGTLVERGYDRKLEVEADRLSVEFASRTGYNPNGLADFLKTLETDKPAGPAAGWFKTHPGPAERLAKVRSEISGLKAVPPTSGIRTSRFGAAVKGLR